MAGTLIFEDEQLAVFWHAGTTEYLLITFGYLGMPFHGNNFFADKPVEKANINCLAFVPKQSSWFPLTSMMPAIGISDQYLHPFTSRVTYGGSMGGYAALKYSRALGATQVLALSPQWSIDPSEWNGEPSGYESYFCPEMAGMGITATEMSGDVFIFYDPADSCDSRHAHKIIDTIYLDIFEIHQYYCSHHVTLVLSGTERLVSLIQACRSGVRTPVQRVATAARRESDLRAHILLEEASVRHPALALNCVTHPRLGAADDIESWTRITAQCIRHMLIRGEYNSAARFLTRVKQSSFWDDEDTRNKVTLVEALIFSNQLKKTNGPVITSHITILAYNSDARKIVHGASSEMASSGSIPLFLAQTGIRTFLRTARWQFLTHIDHDGTATLADVPGLSNSDHFLLVRSEDGTELNFALHCNGKFLCAGQNGVVIGVPWAHVWELFSMPF